MKLDKWQIALRRVGAPEDYYEWCRPYATAQEAWNACPNPGWMLWWLFRINIHDKTRGNDMHRAVVGVLAGLCAEAGPELSEEDRECIAFALQWSRREMSDVAVRKAAVVYHRHNLHRLLDACNVETEHRELPDVASDVMSLLPGLGWADKVRAAVPWVPWLPGAKQWESDGAP